MKKINKVLSKINGISSDIDVVKESVSDVQSMISAHKNLGGIVREFYSFLTTLETALNEVDGVEKMDHYSDMLKSIKDASRGLDSLVVNVGFISKQIK